MSIFLEEIIKSDDFWQKTESFVKILILVDVHLKVWKNCQLLKEAQHQRTIPRHHPSVGLLKSPVLMYEHRMGFAINNGRYVTIFEHT